MMQPLIQRILDVIDRHFPLDDDQRVVCAYGLDLLLYTIISTAGLMMVGVIFHMPMQAAIIIGVFYVNQSVGGGYHADTHLTCFLTMAFGLTLGLWSLTCILDSWIVFGMGVGACFVLFMIPLVLHPNKEYLMGKRKQFMRHSQLVIATECVLIGLLAFLPGKLLFQSVSIGLFVSALSRLTAWMIQEGREKRHK